MLVSADSVVTGHPTTEGDALRIERGLVTQVESLADQRRAEDEGDVNYPGATIVAGLRDAHFHPVNYTAAITKLTLKDVGDFDGLVTALRAEAGGLPPGAPLIATRLDDEALSERTLPTRRELDAAVSDRPVLLFRYCGHLAVANTAALDMAAIGPSTPDPRGGSFDRDQSGTPTGVLRETAVTAVARHVGARGEGLDPADVRTALLGLAGLGLTSIGAIVSAGSLHDPSDDLALLATLGADIPVKMNVLVIAASPADIERSQETLATLGPRVRFLGYKDFADGSLGGRTAAMREPYADAPTTGTSRLRLDRVRPVARTALADGAMVALHAIGDAANEEVLDVFEDLLEGGSDPGQLRVEHASVLSEPDIERFAQLGVTASVQPAFLPSETAWLERRLGADRMPMAYPLRSLLEAGVPLAGGSDCPVEPPHPLWGMAAARDRAGIVPEQGLTGEQALALFTTGAAAAMQEPLPLAPGSPADFVVLDVDPRRCTPQEVRNATVLATYVDGVRVPVEEATLPVWRG